MEKCGYYLLLVEKSTYYVNVINTNPLELILNDSKYTIRDDKPNVSTATQLTLPETRSLASLNLYKDDIFQGRIYNWMYAELEPHIDIVMREREALLNTQIGEYIVTRIVHHTHAYTLYDICRDGIYKQMLINDSGRFISSPNDWIPF